MRRLLDLVLPPRLGVPFRWLLTSSLPAQVGDGIALAAGPLLVASQTRSPTLIAAAAIVQKLPTLFFALYAGAIADRANRRAVVLIANAARVAVLAALVAVIVTGTISIWILLGLLFLVGTAEIFADTGWRAILPSIVPSQDLGIANARMMSGMLVLNQMAGPAIGASLFAAGAAWPFATQVLALLLASALLLKVHVPAVAREGTGDQHVGRDIAEGLRWIWSNAPVRTLTLVILIFNVTWGAPWGILVYWAQERLGISDVGFGLLTTGTAIGGLAAVASYDWLEKRVALATLMKTCLTLEVLVHAALALTTRQTVAMVLMVVFGAYAFVWGSVSQTVRMRATPDRFQGRVGSVYWLGIVLGMVVGELLGGVIAEHFGAAAPFWFAFVGSGLTLVAFWRQLDHIAHSGT